jgi:hypothetical protein
VLGVVAVLFGLGGMILFSLLASDGTVEVQLGDEEYRAGQAQQIADSVPFIVADPIGGGRDIYVQHLGDDPDEGWLAFSARAPGQDDRACSLRWTGDEFEDPCSDETFPPDGEGLTSYAAEVRDGEVFIDLRGTG